MSKVLVTEQYLSDIGSAIRAKAGVSEAFQPAQMASAISEIPSGGGGDLDDFIENGMSGSYENSRATKIAAGAFDYTDITSINFPSATNIGRYAFASCTALATASFPNVTSIGNNAFYSCTSLTSASFPSATSIGSYAFRNCYNLISLYLLGSSVPTLASTNVFMSTPISSYTTSTGGVYGSIYVPASLYNSYKTATNWTAYSSRFVSV